MEINVSIRSTYLYNYGFLNEILVNKNAAFEYYIAAIKLNPLLESAIVRANSIICNFDTSLYVTKLYSTLTRALADHNAFLSANKVLEERYNKLGDNGGEFRDELFLVDVLY